MNNMQPIHHLCQMFYQNVCWTEHKFLSECWEFWRDWEHTQNFSGIQEPWGCPNKCSMIQHFKAQCVYWRGFMIKTCSWDLELFPDPRIFQIIWIFTNLYACEAQICAKAEIRGLWIVFLEGYNFFCILCISKASQWNFERFLTLTFKHLNDLLRNPVEQNLEIYTVVLFLVDYTVYIYIRVMIFWQSKLWSWSAILN